MKRPAEVRAALQYGSDGKVLKTKTEGQVDRDNHMGKKGS